MFGSNFFGQFGIPDFGYQNADPQGGLLGPNTPPNQNDASQPIAGQPSSPAGPASLGPSSPLSPASLTPNAPGQPMTAGPGASMNQQAPAAGIASQFGSQPHG